MRAKQAALTAGALLALLLPPAPSTAQGTAPTQSPGDSLKLSTQLSARDVEVGEKVVVSVTALSTQDGPSATNPRLPVEGAAEVHGPSLRSEFRMFSDGHTLQRQHGVTATWTLTPTQAGTLIVGPSSFQVGAQTVHGERLTVKVRPATGSPRPSPPPGRRRSRSWPDPFGFDPFDWLQRRSPPGDLRDDPFEDLLQQRVPHELRMDRAPDPVGFARMEGTPRRVVLGEQVTLRIYGYGSRGSFRLGMETQPNTANFLSFPIEQHDLVSHRVPIGDQVFIAGKLREVALIPLELGELTITPVELILQGQGYPATGPHGGYLARSQPVTVTVVEPPLAGRPPGYTLGDVGRYTLTAEVEPRQVQEGDFISVTARLKGTGNVPSRLSPAEDQALEWLEPSVTGGVEAQGTTLGGERVFRWTVKAKQAGEIDLGELRLPYYDPERRRYETARAALGVLQVLPGPATGSAEADRDTGGAQTGALELAPRLTLGDEAQQPKQWTDTGYFWWALWGVPLSIPLLGFADRGVQALLARLRQRGSGGKNRVKAQLAQASAELAAGEVQSAAASYERALYEAIELATDLKARGVLREQLAHSLEERQVDATLSEDLAQVVGQLETLRFTGQGDPRALAERVEELARTLLASSKRKQSKP